MQLPWLEQPLKQLSHSSQQQALGHQQQLTKPPGALGQLEDIAVRLAAMQDKTLPELNNIQITVFAGDHGIAAQGVSAFPQAVTVEMIKNFSRGGAAINVLARSLDARLDIINMGTATPLTDLKNVTDKSICAGTKDFSVTSAMSADECEKALLTGAEVIDKAIEQDIDLFIAGEMGIANTSSATALASAILEKNASEITGPGTGLDAEGVEAKASLINAALKQHNLSLNQPVKILQTLGGLEIAAIVGSYIRCAQLGIPVLVDGFITTAAALVASRIKPGCDHWFIYSHASAEPGHQLIMQALNATPLIDLGMRLGEGSGAAVTLPLLKNACLLHSQMATFAEAGVSEKSA